jgi:predicted nucleotidyltransferase
VTKVDERSAAPRVGEHGRRRLAGALDRPGVVSAALLGSHARGDAGPLSDVDVAVWLDPTLSEADHAVVQLALGVAAARALETDEVDLIVLNRAPPLLQHRALRDGVRILDRDRDARVRLDTAALIAFLDTAPLRAEQAARLDRRLAEGRFGRR